MRFVDLFAGLGGFHYALSRLGHTCALACEIDKDLRTIYSKNFGISPHPDIRTLSSQDVPAHDILCAGFPCQPFSKAGGQLGIDCPENGDLFEDHVLRILKARKPKFVIFENVPNLERHNEGTTWASFKKQLQELGYTVDSKILSPHQFGVPQIRERLFIVGRLGGLEGFEWPGKVETHQLSISSVLDKRPADARSLSANVLKCLETWQEFLDRSPAEKRLPSFPIWSMEFRADYPYEGTTPHAVGPVDLRKYRGSHGFLLRKVPPSERMDHLPSYARVKKAKFPRWKETFITQNRTFYNESREWIRPWMKSILEFPPSLQKLEWNCQGEKRDIWRYVIQFRASGVRIKRPTTAPSLIAMTSTQVPIIGWERRYITPIECARLQSLGSLQHLPTSVTAAYEALGNAVNARVVELVAAQLTRTKTLTKKNATPQATPPAKSATNRLVLV
jgi:DNA (cytosine-5)-methyltransferase 1